MGPRLVPVWILGHTPSVTPAKNKNAQLLDHVRDDIRARGLRWTPQRRLLLQVLASGKGHVTGSDLIDRCRAVDPTTTPSTVYRTLDVLEELGYVRHGHGLDGREEYHFLPGDEHGHLFCRTCGRSWEIDRSEAEVLVETLGRNRDFAVDVSHLTVVGQCGACRDKSNAFATSAASA